MGDPAKSENAAVTWDGVLVAAEAGTKALDELEVDLAIRAKLACSIVYQTDEYRFNRWLEALRGLRAAWDGIEP